MLSKSSVIILICACCPLLTGAQALIESQLLNVQDGLPSNRIYETAGIPAGPLFLATNNGLCRYDGYRFVTNPYVKGAVKEVMYHNGYFYFYASETGLCRCRDIFDRPEVLRSVNFSDSTPENDHFGDLFADAAGRIWNTGINEIKFLRPEDGRQSICFYRRADHRPQKNFIYFFEPSNGEIWLISAEGIHIRYPLSRRFIRLPDTAINRLPYCAAYFDGNQTLYLATDNGRLFAYNIVTKRQKALPKFPGNLVASGLSLLKNGNTTYLIANSTRRVAALDLRKLQWQHWYDADGAIILQVRPDQHLAIIWVATGKGLVRLSQQKLKLHYIRLSAGRGRFVNSIVRDAQGHLWISNGTPRIWRRNRNGTLESFLLPNQKAACNRLTITHHCLLAATNAGVYRYRAGRFYRLPLAGRPNAATETAVTDRRNRLWLVQSGRLRVFDGETLQPLPQLIQNSPSFWKKNRINDLYIDPKTGRIWLAAWMPASFGIAFYDTHRKKVRSIEPFNNPSLFMGDYYVRVARSADGNLLFSGFGGWNRVSPQGKIIDVLNTSVDKVASSELGGISGDTSGNVWFGTSEGLYFYQKSSDKAIRFSQADGLPTNDFTHGFCDLPGSLLAIGLKDAVLLLDQKQLLQPRRKDPPVLTAIRCNGKLQAAPTGVIELENNTTDLYLYFSPLTFADESSLQYRFRFSGDTSWSLPTRRPELHFPRLDYGTYEIVVIVGDNLGNWQNENPLIIRVSVPVPFYRQVWFVILAGVLLGVAVFGATRFFFLQREQRKQIQQQLNDARLASIRNQMNPHFLFNTLNSINSYILRHQTNDASNYLTLFSKLVRNILNHSRLKRVTLKKELQTLKLYLELEGMRLNHSFDYAIRIAPDIEPEMVQMPPLLLQPFVENAIWHGIRHKKESGNISIDVAKTSDQQLQIIITDDGIGRAAAAERQKNKEKHSSLGITITQNYLKLINEKNNVEIEDLYDRWGAAAGTKILLTINL